RARRFVGAPGARGGQVDLRVRMREPAQIGLQQVMALRFRYVADESAPGFGKEAAQAIEKPIDFVAAAEEDAPQDEREAALGMRGAIRQRERAAPGAAED